MRIHVSVCSAVLQAVISQCGDPTTRGYPGQASCEEGMVTLREATLFKAEAQAAREHPGELCQGDRGAWPCKEAFRQPPISSSEANKGHAREDEAQAAW